MSILFVLLMFLLVMSVSYFRTRSRCPRAARSGPGPQAPRMQREYGCPFPKAIAFIPGTPG